MCLNVVLQKKHTILKNADKLFSYITTRFGNSTLKREFLYYFISNLEVGELRFCKQQLQLDQSKLGRANWVLFQALESMQTFDQEKLKELTEKEIEPKFLAITKTRLYQRLIEEVKRLRAQRLPANHPKRCLEEGQVLYRMHMNEEAAEVLNRGLNHVAQHENLQLEVMLCNLLRMVYKDMPSKELVDVRTQLEYQQIMATSKLATLSKYIQINDRMFDYLRNYRVTSAETVKRGIEELMNTPEMKEVHRANSLAAQIKYFTIWQMYYSQQNDLENSIEMNRRVIELRESDPALLVEEAITYSNNLSNIIGKLTLLGRTEEALKYLQKFEQAPVKDRQSEVVKFRDLAIAYQLYYLNKGDIRAVLNHEEGLMAGLRKFGKQIDRSSNLAIRYNLGIAHMLVGNHGKAKRHFDLIRQMGELPVRFDLQGVSRLLRLIMLCVEEDRVTFEHFLRNSKKFFQQGARQYPMENVIYAWVEEHAQTVDKTAKRASYQKLEEQLASFVAETMLGAEEIQIWAEAQRRGITGEMVLKERLAANK